MSAHATPPASHAEEGAAEADLAQPFEGGLDGFTRDGFIAGWACRSGVIARHRVQVLWQNEVIGEAIADSYRRDLLQAGKGLGHCGFFARLRRPLPPGEHMFSLRIPHDAPAAAVEIGDLPPLLLPAAPERRAMLPASPRARESWSDDDILTHLAQFDLARQCQSMGCARFVDVVYRFILDRWADENALGLYPPILEKASLTPDAFFSIILTCDERKGSAKPVPSPFDYRFPFASIAG